MRHVVKALWFTALTVATIMAACTGADPGETRAEDTAVPSVTGGAAATAEQAEGGTVVMAMDAEPAMLNVHLPEGNDTATWLVTSPVLLGAFRVTPEFAYEPVLIDEATVTEDPFAVTYRIKEEAAWADGTPVSAEDFVFTWRTYMEPDNEVTSRAGYELITDADVSDPKTVTFTFAEVFAPWRDLFAQVLPEHVLEGKDFNAIWNDRLTASNGPFVFDAWDRGQQLSLVRNEAYWGEPVHLDGITFRFVADADTAAQQLRGGEVDVMAARPTEALVDQLETAQGVVFDVGSGTAWEHLDFNLQRPPLDQLFVRQAIAHGIDRDLITQELVAPVNPDAMPLNSVVYMNEQPQYKDNWGESLTYDPEAAVRLLTDNGCQRGDDGIFTCAGERLSFDYATIEDVPLRGQLFEVIQVQLQDIGVEVNAAFADPARLFGDIWPAGDFDLIEFAWVGGPDPWSGTGIWTCGGDLNQIGYCDRRVTNLLDRTSRIADPHRRAEVFNEVDVLIAQDLPAVPLFQTPSMVAWDEALTGPQDNPTTSGPTWNIEDWAFSR